MSLFRHQITQSLPEGRITSREQKLVLLLPAFFQFILLAAIPARAATYYVAKTGSDHNTCKTAAGACLTIAHARSLALTAGDVIEVEPGMYTESVVLTQSGSSTGGNIVLRGHAGDNCPTVPVADKNSPTGFRPAPTVTIAGNITLAGSYLTVDCLHIETAETGAIVVKAGSTGGVITNNDLDGHGAARNGGGLMFTGPVPLSRYASKFLVSHNYIHAVSTGVWFYCTRCTMLENEITALAGDEPGSDHDYIDAWGVDSVIRHNYMHENTCNACNGYDCHMDCIQAWNTTGDGTEVSKNMTFDRNVCFNHHEGVILQDNAGNNDVGNWTVSNNVFAYGPYDDGSGHLCAAGASHSWCWIFEDGNLGKDNTFSNNTCIDGAEGFRNNSGAARFTNNLFLSLKDRSVVYQNSPGATTGANNLYYATGATFGSGAYTGDIINQDPQILDAGTGSDAERCLGCDFGIQSTSPAKGAGTPGDLPFDLRGVARPQNAPDDLGAYKAVASTPSTMSKPGSPARQ